MLVTEVFLGLFLHLVQGSTGSCHSILHLHALVTRLLACSTCDPLIRYFFDERVYAFILTEKRKNSRELSKARLGRRVERVRQSPAEIGEGTKPKIQAGDRASDRDSYLIDSISRLPRRAVSHRAVPRRSHISRTCSATSSRPRIPMTDFNGSGSFTNQPGSIAIRRFDDSL